jgi:glycosyltransferase involved in cell wall biosynthesis
MDRSPSTPRTVLHLVASPFLGGPERQMIGLSRAQRGAERTVFLGFPEGGDFDARLRREGIESHLLASTGRPLLATVREVEGFIREIGPDVVITHGYKPDLVGLLATRRTKVPLIAVAHGWTGATFRVRLNEAIDKLLMRRARRVVAVSARQGERVKEAGVRPERVVVVRNAIDPSRFPAPDAATRGEMEALFPVRPAHLVIAAGRLSPEKGFADLVRAARLVADRRPGVGFLLVGDGPLREPLAAAIREAGLEQTFVLAGFRDDLDRLMANADLFVQSSHTEGMPNVVLEAGACAVPIVATAVGGTGEVLEDGRGGHLVPPRKPEDLAARILDLLADPVAARKMGAEARRRVVAEFTFAAKAAAYRRMFEECLP